MSTPDKLHVLMDARERRASCGVKRKRDREKKKQRWLVYCGYGKTDPGCGKKTLHKNSTDEHGKEDDFGWECCECGRIVDRIPSGCEVKS
jgi:hypothetical protein